MYNEVEIQKKETLNKYLVKVFGYMFLGLSVSALVAYGLFNVPAMQRVFYMFLSSRYSVLIICVIQIVLTMAISNFVGKAKALPTFIIFILYSITFSFTFAVIGLAFDIGAITQAFISAALLFLALSIIGYTTKRDLSSLGTIFFVGLIVLIIMSLLNAFVFKSSGFSFIVSLVGIVIFCGLTAYDVQKIKAFYLQTENNPELRNALAIYGALTLFLDFINIFMYLLRIFGSDGD